MTDQNNEDFKDLEMPLRKALSAEKQTGLSAAQLNSLHLMISKDEHPRAKVRSRWLNWVLPSSILATAMVALIVFNRFPKQESPSTETAAPWVNSESTVATGSPPAEKEPKKSVAMKKDTTPTAPAAMSSGRSEIFAERKEESRHRAGPQLAKPSPTKTIKEKSWESKGANSKKVAVGLSQAGGGDLSGKAADQASKFTSGDSKGKSLGSTANLTESRSVSKDKNVMIIQSSTIPQELRTSLDAKIKTLSLCSSNKSIWQVRFTISKSGSVVDPKASKSSGDAASNSTMACIVSKMKTWTFTPSSQGPVEVKIQFSPKE
jgi:hypothetical protein